MKRLYLVRHAKSSWDDPDLADFERSLNKRGKRDAPFMARRIAEQGAKPDIIISSPAKRAILTARAFAEALEYPEHDIVQNKAVYLADVSGLLQIIRAIDNSKEQAMIFGHNPGFTSLANFLGKRNIDNIPTCGVYCLDFDELGWSKVGRGKGIFRFFDYPKKHLK